MSQRVNRCAVRCSWLRTMQTIVLTFRCERVVFYIGEKSFSASSDRLRPAGKQHAPRRLEALRDQHRGGPFADDGCVRSGPISQNQISNAKGIDGPERLNQAVLTRQLTNRDRPSRRIDAEPDSGHLQPMLPLLSTALNAFQLAKRWPHFHARVSWPDRESQLQGDARVKGLSHEHQRQDDPAAASFGCSCRLC